MGRTTGAPGAVEQSPRLVQAPLQSSPVLRRLLNVVTALSLLLCFLAVVLWVRSYWTTESVRFGATRMYQATSGRGIFMIAWYDSFRRQVNFAWVGNGGYIAGTYHPASSTSTWRHYAASPDPWSGRRRPRWVYERSAYPDRSKVASPAADLGSQLLPHLTTIELVERGVEDWQLQRRDEDRLSGRAVLLPYWLLASALAAVLPARWALLTGGRWRSTRRHARGRCPSCGYDLRATPGRCPECGTESKGAA